jgi:hypothetical protein
MSFLPKYSAPGSKPKRLGNFTIAGSMIMLFCLTGCASNKQVNFGAFFAQLTPEPWTHPGVWDFQVKNSQNESIGELRMHLTGESASEFCDDGDWKRADIIHGSIDYDFGFDLRPAYRVHGNWITLDLTAAVCGADHLLNGELSDTGASGFFNYSHRLGGNNVGTFIAVPAAD